MEKTYSTVEMIGILKPGIKAVTKGSKHDVVIMGDDGGIYWSCGMEQFELNSFIMSREWNILPREVTFMEAMEALRDGKRIKHSGMEGTEYREFFLKDLSSGMSLRRVHEGQWYIIDGE